MAAVYERSVQLVGISDISKLQLLSFCWFFVERAQECWTWLIDRSADWLDIVAMLVESHRPQYLSSTILREERCSCWCRNIQVWRKPWNNIFLIKEKADVMYYGVSK